MSDIAKLVNEEIVLSYDSPDGTKSVCLGLDQVNTQEKLLGMISHLCPKAWVTRKHIQYLISLANEHNDLKINFNL